MLAAFRQRSVTATEAAAQLGVALSRFYVLSTDYLRACARKEADSWIPGTSGGDHTTTWPKPVTELLKKRLACSPPCPYSFAASEALRLHAFKLDRAQVRRWAIQNGLAHPNPPKRPHAPVRRWQRSQIGELWQLDASPHRWFPPCSLDFPMLNMLDDCSRLFVGSKIYDRELLLSYLDFLPAAFLTYGRPLQIYVDYHAIFFAQNPEALTQLGAALKFYDISFLYAPTPQAKGKIEREHQFWQGRLRWGGNSIAKKSAVGHSAQYTLRGGLSDGAPCGGRLSNFCDFVLSLFPVQPTGQTRLSPMTYHASNDVVTLIRVPFEG